MISPSPNPASEVALAPCPFCGGAARISTLPMGIGPAQFRANCTSCDMLMPLCRFEQSAIAAWNARASTQAAGVREALTEEERHAVSHARYQVEHASADNPDCSFDFELVATLLKIIDRASSPAPLMTQPVREALEVSEAMLDAGAQALANDVWHPPQLLKNLSGSDVNRLKRQALLVLKAALASLPPEPASGEGR